MPKIWIKGPQQLFYSISVPQPSSSPGPPTAATMLGEQAQSLPPFTGSFHHVKWNNGNDFQPGVLNHLHSMAHACENEPSDNAVLHPQRGYWKWEKWQERGGKWRAESFQRQIMCLRVDDTVWSVDDQRGISNIAANVRDGVKGLLLG